jgi:two-component system OmpR family sensor kinase
MKLFGRFRRRVLAHGLVVMILMAAAVTIADRVFVNRWVEHELVQRRVRVNSELSIYAADGSSLLGSNSTPVVPPPPSDVLAELARGAVTITRGDVVMTGVFRDGAFAGAVVRRLPPPLAPYPGPPLALVFVTLAVCMIATLLVSLPLARSVVHPVEALARSVKRFGTGELATRASLSRGDEIGQLAAAFNEMASRIETLVGVEKRLLANVSHELRTPLARIRVVLELASDGDPERVRSYLGELGHDLAELETLVNDVLTTAWLDVAARRLGDGGVPMRWTKASVGELVEKSRARFATLHGGSGGGALEVVTDGTLPDIECDPSLLRRAVDNLLDNAAKYAEGARVEMRVGTSAEHVSIDVIDEGAGMSPEAAARAFEPFFRADESRDRRTGGLGLGLSIVRTIVEAHGGVVTLDSARGRGTKVSLRLPRRRA